jgi:TrmH family RNA methyltransferase
MSTNGASWSALTAWLGLLNYGEMTPHARITSRQNPRIKEAARLRTGRGRQRQGRFIIDGAREIDRAMAAGIRAIEAYVCEELCNSPDAQAAVNAVKASGADMISVTPDVYAKLAFGDRQDGVIVVAETPIRRLSDVILGPTPLAAVLEGIEKPGNLGAILRSADAAGIDAVIVADSHTDLYNPNTIRASLGTVFRANVCVATTVETIDWLADRGMSIIAARPDADVLYTDADMRGRVAIVLGSEAGGLTDAWRGSNVTPVRLPMHGLADSLNVSTAAAVLFYEALRQRK